MSMGFLVPQDAPIAWRGLMVQKAMNQLLFEVAWPKLDLLVLHVVGRYYIPVLAARKRPGKDGTQLV